MRSSQAQVLIVGSGPSGLVVALTLLKNGVPVRIIERDAKHHIGERGSGIMPRILEIEHFLGVADDVKAASDAKLTLQVYGPNDAYRPIISKELLEHVDPTPAFPETEGRTLGQFKHEEILRKYIEALGGRVELGTALVGFEQDDNGVHAELTKTSVDDQVTAEKATFKYLVGADGAHSVVRKVLQAGFLGETRDEGNVYIADSILEGLPNRNEQGNILVHIWGDHLKSRVVIRSTNKEGGFQVMFTGTDLDYATLKERKNIETVQKTMNEITGRTNIVIKDITWQGEWRPNIRMAEHFQNGRVFIVGDAAHVHPPTGGQGLNSGMQDAFNLSWKLALAIEGHAAPGLLGSYEAERMPVIAEMLQLSTSLYDKMNSAGSTDASSVEIYNRASAALAATDAQEDKQSRWFRGRQLFQLDVHYRWSPVVYDERLAHAEDIKEAKDAYGVAGRAMHAGDRAPDAQGLAVPVDGMPMTRLFDIFDPAKHTALLFSPAASASEVLALLEPLKAKGLGADRLHAVLVLPRGSVADDAADASSSGIEVVVDAEGHAYDAYGASSAKCVPTVVIVRPDGIVGAFATEKEGVEKYVNAVYA